MKIKAIALLTLVHQTLAFAPTAFTSRSNTFKQHSIVDPSIFHDAPQHIETLSNFFSSINLADADLEAAAEAVSNVVADPTPVATVAQEAAATAAASPNNGWFGFLAGPIEFILEGLHGLFSGLGLTANSWGLAIIFMTTLIKLVTYPLTAQQLESTAKMQVSASSTHLYIFNVKDAYCCTNTDAFDTNIRTFLFYLDSMKQALQPTIKDLQAKYQSNPEVMNQKIAAVYQDNQVNPLAGCIPSLVQIPIFVGLYRAVLNLANEDKLNEPFLWLPNLEGPTYGADPASASSWLFSGWVDGVPSLGWDDTLAFLTIPVVLVLSQSVSMNLMASKDQEQPAFIKFLPLLIGWFSLNVPAALGIYWVANNFITTALTLQIRSNIKPVTPVTGGSSSAAASNVIDAQPTTFTPTPMREKPAGFGASDWSDDGDSIKPITPIDAEIEESGETAQASGEDQSKKNKKRGGKKKKKRN